MQYIRLLLFYSVIFQSVIFQSCKFHPPPSPFFDGPSFSTPANSSHQSPDSVLRSKVSTTNGVVASACDPNLTITCSLGNYDDCLRPSLGIRRQPCVTSRAVSSLRTIPFTPRARRKRPARITELRKSVHTSYVHTGLLMTILGGIALRRSDERFHSQYGV